MSLRDANIVAVPSASFSIVAVNIVETLFWKTINNNKTYAQLIPKNYETMNLKVRNHKTDTIDH